jgi:hypothetical protein
MTTTNTTPPRDETLTAGQEREAGLAAWYAVYHPDTVESKMLTTGDLLRLLGRVALERDAQAATVARLLAGLDVCRPYLPERIWDEAVFVALHDDNEAAALGRDGAPAATDGEG